MRNGRKRMSIRKQLEAGLIDYEELTMQQRLNLAFSPKPASYQFAGDEDSLIDDHGPVDEPISGCGCFRCLKPKKKEKSDE